ncbi:MAG: type II toxin-antitoxin system HicB family antitoxin [candidate division NC10 bacterium]|nr:type II toxin-antitoxin system HicB family antitoxin [candidate division NC10 bacterium]
MSRLLEDYTIVIRPDDNGTYVAYVPAMEGCYAWGRTLDEARAELVNVFDMIKEEYKEEGRPLPPDVKVVVVDAH